MTIKKKGSAWFVDVRPEGRAGKRVTRKFTTKAEAVRFESFVISQAAANKAWNPSQQDKRRLSELIELWNEGHAKTLSSGAVRYALLVRWCKDLNDPVAASVRPEHLIRWRSERLAVLKATTVNIELQAVKSLFNWLQKAQLVEFPNPAAHIQAIKVAEVERPFLSQAEVAHFYSQLSSAPGEDIAVIAQTCLETGARWSEVEKIQWEHVREDRLIFTNTKSKKTRTVPIRPELYVLLCGCGNRSAKRLFGSRAETARKWLNRLWDLPDGISTHILRHTFASHFVMAGGNILTLQRILGHSKIDMTMRYAHLAPSHLQEVLSLNPGVLLEKKWRVCGK
ncbi:phage integrase [Aliamphritea spongicola]|uniref:phage integrase n=1 Tax=Aliamphritea spongicola TaxID=707589 RepID=UPI00196B673D|nr:tyrosine-type recombinase/integrase [Aliamphritea spongicola]MBN3560553.1 tyrosine-type recombinase/integrase [Aliamphritea spongicola]